MKKFKVLILILLIFLSGCTGSDDNLDKTHKNDILIDQVEKLKDDLEKARSSIQELQTLLEEKQEVIEILEVNYNQTMNHSIDVRDYFQSNDIKKIFNGGFENEGYSVVTEFVDGNRVQLKTEDTGTGVVKIYQLDSEEIKLIFHTQEESRNINYLLKGPIDNKIILKAPIKIGTEWEDMEGYKTIITGIGIIVDTPSGLYNTIETTHEFDGGLVRNYYALEVGIVKSLTDYNDGFELISELIKIEKSSKQDD